jgi:hypothetical protein
MTLNVVEQQIIPLRTNSEELGIDVYRMPSGEIRVGVSSIGQVLGYTNNWFKRIVGSPSKKPKALQSLGFSGEVETVLIEGTREPQEVQTISLEDFERLLHYGVLNGKKPALAFLISKATVGFLEALRCTTVEGVNQSFELYELDFYAWTQQQAEFLQHKKWSCLDVPNLVEEIESLGKQQRQELGNRLGILLGHLLKWEFQPSHRSKSWLATIREQRRQVLRLLKESPSLQPYLLEAMEDGYQSALNLAVSETPLDYEDFPQECSYSSGQVLDPQFLPTQHPETDEG